MAIAIDLMGLFCYNLSMHDKITFNRTLLISVLVLALIIPACNSKKVILPTETMLPGTSPVNPAPVGVEVNADNMKFTVTGTVRPADSIVASGSMFNSQPGEHQQYFFVKLNVACETSPEQQCHLSLYKMTLMGSAGILTYPARIITGVDDVLENADFYGGTTISGFVPFIISIGDSRLQLIYQSLSGDSFYLALP